jgi:hypothetical protein
MSAEEYASKELHEWREATIKKDIEVRTAIRDPDLVGSRTFVPIPYKAGLQLRIRLRILYPDPYPVLNKKTVVFGNRGFNPGFHLNMMNCKWALLFLNLFDPLRCNTK